MDSRRRRYALAGALAVRTGEFLCAVHSAVGAPCELPSNEDRATTSAALRSYGAAAACSTLTARLLLAEAIDMQAQSDGSVSARGLFESAHAGSASAWRANILAAAAAIAELEAAKSAWQLVHRTMSGQVVAIIETLLSYTAQLTDVLEVDRPATHI